MDQNVIYEKNEKHIKKLLFEHYVQQIHEVVGPFVSPEDKIKNL